MDQNSITGGFPPTPGQAQIPPVQPAGGNYGTFEGTPVGGAQGAVAPTPAPNSGMAPMPAPAPIPPASGGSRKGSIVETIILIVVCLIAAAAIVMAVMFYMQWNDLNTDFEAKKSLAMAEAEKAASDQYAEELQEALKRDTVQFTGPDDFGRISFSYPKIWSVYEAENGLQNSDYVAYFAPAPVRSIDDESARYAIRFSILNENYNDVYNDYNNRAEYNGATKRTFMADNGKISGIRYDGTLDEGIVGTVVIAKVNDKTLVLQSDAATFSDSFEAVLSTLRRGN